MRGSTAGLADALDGESVAHKTLLALLDLCISCTVVAPAVVGYWRGTWNLAGLYLYPDSVLLSGLTSAVFGLVGNVTLTALQKPLKDRLHPDKSRLVYYTVSRLYTYVFGAVSVNFWRGTWLLLEQLLKERGGGLAATVVSLVALAALRCFRNITATPFALITDKAPQYFDVPTMFRISSTKEPLLYVLDCLFSVVVVGSLVVFVWRGAWDLLDVYLYPQDKAWSAWASFIIGYGLAIVTFLLQGAARRACARLKGANRLIVADLFLLLSFVATINVWRSIWALLDIYVLPDNQELSNWLTHCGCFLLLMLLNCGNSVLVRGVYIDAEEEGGQCVVFPCYYLRLFFQKERLKKKRRLLEAVACEKRDGDIAGAMPLIPPKGVTPTIVRAVIPAGANHVVIHPPGDPERTVENNNT